MVGEFFIMDTIIEVKEDQFLSQVSLINFKDSITRYGIAFHEAFKESEEGSPNYNKGGIDFLSDIILMSYLEEYLEKTEVWVESVFRGFTEIIKENRDYLSYFSDLIF